MNRIIAFAFFIAAAAVIIFAPRGPGPEVKATLTPPRLDLRRVPANMNFTTMTPMDRQRVTVAVIYFCLDRYQRDSCLHHLITCGDECKKLISPKKWAFLKTEYAKVRSERGL